MGYDDCVLEHLNEFNNSVTNLISNEAKMDEEDHCVALLHTFPDSCDNLVITIGSTVKKLVLDGVKDDLPSKEVRRKAIESTNMVLSIHGIEQEKKEERNEKTQIPWT